MAFLGFGGSKKFGDISKKQWVDIKSNLDVEIDDTIAKIRDAGHEYERLAEQAMQPGRLEVEEQIAITQMGEATDRQANLTSQVIRLTEERSDCDLAIDKWEEKERSKTGLDWGEFDINDLEKELKDDQAAQNKKRNAVRAVKRLLSTRPEDVPLELSPSAIKAKKDLEERRAAQDRGY